MLDSQVDEVTGRCSCITATSYFTLNTNFLKNVQEIQAKAIRCHLGCFAHLLEEVVSLALHSLVNFASIL